MDRYFFVFLSLIWRGNGHGDGLIHLTKILFWVIDIEEANNLQGLFPDY